MSDCDCSRCQTEGCNANALCPCCLKAEVERLTAELAERDQRIALAVAFCDEFSGVQVAVTTARILRGES